ncbi:hypothetical protein [Streptomyces canus]|uniref:hypothetical protein n=1 Tax=Streptomyces canus TaxID=58343 RepID=UPI00358E5C6B
MVSFPPTGSASTYRTVSALAHQAKAPTPCASRRSPAAPRPTSTRPGPGHPRHQRRGPRRRRLESLRRPKRPDQAAVDNQLT